MVEVPLKMFNFDASLLLSIGPIKITIMKKRYFIGVVSALLTLLFMCVSCGKEDDPEGNGTTDEGQVTVVDFGPFKLQLQGEYEVEGLADPYSKEIIVTSLSAEDVQKEMVNIFKQTEAIASSKNFRMDMGDMMEDYPLKDIEKYKSPAYEGDMDWRFVVDDLVMIVSYDDFDVERKVIYIAPFFKKTEEGYIFYN